MKNLKFVVLAALLTAFAGEQSLASDLSFSETEIAHNNHILNVKREDAVNALLSEYALPEKTIGAHSNVIGAEFSDSGYIKSLLVFDREGPLKYVGEKPGITVATCWREDMAFSESAMDYMERGNVSFFIIDNSAGALLAKAMNHVPDIDSIALNAKRNKLKVGGNAHQCQIPKFISHPLS
ncbi:MAG: hypothetical protein CMF12_01110 [Idiomarina sp.]|uniref:hypothetical protein n=1 Tax=Idiomarina sp. TaxID=1874361 RepID=UPI000C4081F7|nr:hypothetical protein [Idiomarina sp.]MBT41099.1 hypothetical protein [Idiomarina sp.]